MSAAEEPNVLNDPNAVADALTEVADWHCVECIDMHGEADEDGPGAGCCFHAKAAYRTNEAAVMLRRLLAERDALAARLDSILDAEHDQPDFDGYMAREAWEAAFCRIAAADPDNRSTDG